jgi:sec-independent protein translocase protein TatA
MRRHVMKLFGMGMPELIVILVVILVIFGPKNLPKLGSALGKAVKGVREGVDSVNTELEAAKESVDNTAKNAKGEQAADAPITATAVVGEVPVEAAAAAPAETAAAAPAAAFCSQCGAGFEADARFCKKCGASAS